ncbi:MAG: metalloregulator ArsR/SmtB family transcription factor [Hyphomonas sp.]|uniref:ArsR/SmtB family transcription factor n=1 Tax=Hyphomonas sp. TaxID=87 RepID=UPI001830C453|nr:metalloregulator ArsR/SmtB family transcription factor [Hyphomonas sp.]MBA3067772.1 metalloregulator ArsR/SmtB family transcription factor [Hyphomonas sp.]MBU3919754.1 metalloregulator ArsR/SmtB family transcription factor [Alphaproteobacteria bacterium]MBU4062140.1 metalloregulator ArsR/SmtB family transcription factor [Alphaproteobacteria bacterium]MBU4165575.1 metalloregulator ArsR/SmtB family transcription factor [Alphaproteobacteria bacterium]
MITILSALAEPTRLGALRLLADGGEHCVCELMDKLGASQSRMSRHMNVLKINGLVVDRRDAQWVRFRINPELPPHVKTVIDSVLAAADAELAAPKRKAA